MTNFFYHLTKNNWGFPWHIILAWMGMIFGIGIIGYSLQGVIGISMVIISIGILYEREQNFKADWWQDMIANIIGVVLGIVSFWWIL